jgi:hypothetical protein
MGKNACDRATPRRASAFPASGLKLLLDYGWPELFLDDGRLACQSARLGNDPRALILIPRISRVSALTLTFPVAEASWSEQLFAS